MSGQLFQRMLGSVEMDFIPFIFSRFTRKDYMFVEVDVEHSVGPKILKGSAVITEVFHDCGSCGD